MEKRILELATPIISEIVAAERSIASKRGAQQQGQRACASAMLGRPQAEKAMIWAGGNWKCHALKLCARKLFRRSCRSFLSRI